MTISRYFGYPKTTFPFDIMPEFLNKYGKKQYRIKVFKKYEELLIIKKYKHLDFIILDKKIYSYRNKIRALLKNNIVTSKEFFKLQNKLHVFILLRNKIKTR